MAGPNVGYATLSVIPSAKGALGDLQKELAGPLDAAGESAGDSAAKKFGGKFSGGMKKAGVLAGAALAGGMLAFGKSAISAASDVNESMSKVQVVFGDSSDSVIAWSKTAATAMGQSQGQALEAVGTYGNLLKAFGLTGDQATTMSKSMVGLATDLASFNNTSVDEALQALQSGLTGETEPLKKFGVAINDVRLKDEAVRLGLIATTKDALSPAAKAQASYSLIMHDTTLAQGDFARTSDGLANKQKILSAQFADVSAKIGAVLLPILTTVAGFVADHMGPVLIALGVVLGVMFAIWVVGAISAAAATIAAAAPFIAIGLVIAAVAAGVIYAYTHFQLFRDIIQTVVEVFKTIWDFISSKIIPIFAFLIENYVKALVVEFKAIVWVVENVLIPAFQAVWSFIQTKVIPIFTAIVTTLISVASSVSEKIGDIVGFVTGIPGRISATISSLWDGLKSGIDTARQWVSDKIDAVVGFATGLPGRLAGLFGGMWDGIKEAFRSAINFIIRGWNGLQFSMPSFDTHIPGVGTIGGFTIGLPDIPLFDSGGFMPGAAGSHGLAILKAGEMVLTQAQQNAGGSGFARGDRVVFEIEGMPLTAVVKSVNRDLVGALSAGRR